jgi:hypothetical protein
MKWSRTFEAWKQVSDVGGIVNKSVLLRVPCYALKASDYNLVSFYTREDYFMYFELEKKPEPPAVKKPPVDLEKPTQHSHYLA